jgi:plastocyanin
MKTRSGLNWVVIGFAAPVVVTLIALAIFAPFRRIVLNPLIIAYGQPAEGVTTVIVREDALQRHVFDPPVIRIRAGETVTWRFQDTSDSGAHNVVSFNIPGEDFASQILLTGEFTHTFDTPGTYLYDCTLHSQMRGRIEVVSANREAHRALPSGE